MIPMRKLVVVMVLCLAVLAACAQPPADVPRAEVKDEMKDDMKDMPAHDDMKDEMADEKMDDMKNESMDKMTESMTDKEMTNESMEKNESMETAEVTMEGDKTDVNGEASSFTFTGYGPGKEHAGTFDDWTGHVYVKDGAIVGAEGVIQAESVNTGIGGLDTHLKNDDFFHVEEHPEIRFGGSIADGVMTGPLSFHGVTHEVSFPVNVTESSVSADFLLDVTPFNFKYTGINKDVRIEFTASI